MSQNFADIWIKMGEALEGIDKEIRTRYNKHSSYYIYQGVPVEIQGKRELGETPKRSRRCKREAICRIGHWFFKPGRPHLVQILKSENLPMWSQYMPCATRNWLWEFMYNVGLYT